MGYEGGDGIIPPFPSHGPNITGHVLVTGIFAVSVLTLLDSALECDF